MKPQVLLFTSPRCPHCPAAKKWAQEHIASDKELEYFEFSSLDPGAREMAEKFQVRSVPTFIIIGTNYDKPIGISGTPSEERFKKLLGLARGELSEEDV